MKLPVIIRAARRGYRPGRYKGRLAFALALSLLIHGLILSLQFGVAGFGLPGLAMPWTERRAHSWVLSARLAERPTAPAVPAAPPETALAPLAVRPPAAATSVLRERPKPARPKRTEKPVEAPPPVDALAELRPLVAEPQSLPPREIPEPAPPAEQPQRETVIPKQPQPDIIAQKEAEQETFSVPPPAEPQEQRAPDDAAKEAAARAQAEAERRAQEQEAIRLEETRKVEEARKLEETRKLEQAQAEREAQELEARRQAEAASRAAAMAREAEQQARQQEEERKQEEASRAALELEARRKAEAAERQQALALERQKEEALRLEEARREEEARQARLAMELEALSKAEEAARRAELARQRELEARRQAEELAARQRAQELAERQRAEALAQSQRERERLAAESAPPRAAPGAVEGGRPAGAPSAPVAPSGRDLAAKALEQLRSPGAARSEPQRPRSAFDFPESPRRRSILGGIDRDIGVRMYIESWRAKIERNGNLNIPPSARTRSHEDPIVTVAVRSDGSVESVFIHRSSGLREVDDAVRRIAQLYSPYSAFPPALARVYDVIEIRHIWYFSDTLRLLEEMR